MKFFFGPVCLVTLFSLVFAGCYESSSATHSSAANQRTGLNANDSWPDTSDNAVKPTVRTVAIILYRCTDNDGKTINVNRDEWKYCATLLAELLVSFSDSEHLGRSETIEMGKIAARLLESGSRERNPSPWLRAPLLILRQFEPCDNDDKKNYGEVVSFLENVRGHFLWSVLPFFDGQDTGFFSSYKGEVVNGIWNALSPSSSPNDSSEVSAGSLKVYTDPLDVMAYFINGRFALNTKRNENSSNSIEMRTLMALSKKSEKNSLDAWEILQRIQLDSVRTKTVSERNAALAPFAALLP